MTETDDVYAEVERRKKRAWDLEIPQRVSEFYHETVLRWLQGMPECIHPSVSDITECGPGVIQFKVRGYTFCFSLHGKGGSLGAQAPGWKPFPSSESGQGEGLLRVQWDQRLILELVVQYRTSLPWTRLFQPKEVTAFVEGAWVGTLLELAVASEEHLRNLRKMDEEREMKAAEARRNDPKRIERLKRRFGL